MHRCHFAGHYQALGLSTLTLHNSVSDFILSVGLNAKGPVAAVKVGPEGAEDGAATLLRCDQVLKPVWRGILHLTRIHTWC